MSPEEVNSLVNKKQYVTAALTLAITLISFFVARAFSTSDIEAANLGKRIDGKADIVWVREVMEINESNDVARYKAHEATDAARYQGIKDMFVITSGQLKEIKEDIREIRKNQN